MPIPDSVTQASIYTFSVQDFNYLVINLPKNHQILRLQVGLLQLSKPMTTAFTNKCNRKRSCNQEGHY